MSIYIQGPRITSLTRIDEYLYLGASNPINSLAY